MVCVGRVEGEKGFSGREVEWREGGLSALPDALPSMSLRSWRSLRSFVA